MTFSEEGRPPMLDPEVAAWLTRPTTSGDPGNDSWVKSSLADLRTETRSTMLGHRGPEYVPVELHTVREAQFMVRDGDTIGLRIYEPSDTTDDALIYVHGGGFVACDLDTHDPVCRVLAASLHVSVVSVDYRLAPEFQHPIPLHDVEDVLAVVSNEPARLGISARRMFVAGDSAGGNLITAALMRQRDDRVARVAGQLLIYPGLDLTWEGLHESDLPTYPGVALTPEIATWAVAQYVPDDVCRTDSAVSPLRASDFRGFPPTVIATGECDLFTPQAERFAVAVARAGGAVAHLRFGGLPHGFMDFADAVPVARAARTRVVSTFRSWANL